MSTLLATLGALEVAILIASVLYGVTTLQAWLYAEKYSTDKWYLRIMVSVLPMFYYDILMNTLLSVQAGTIWSAPNAGFMEYPL